jgi:hypothetical protein
MHLPTLFASALLAATAAAQCSFASVSLSSYGQPCMPVFATPATLGGGLDTSACTLGLTVNATQGCCNTVLVGRLLALGLQSTNQPLPFLGAGCTLLAQPDVILFLPSSAGPTFVLQLPRTLSGPAVLFAQGAALYVTFGVQTDAQLTQGQQVTLQ